MKRAGIPMKLTTPNALVTTEWLEAHLDDPDLRLFDCSTFLALREDGDKPYDVVSCREEHQAGHIPGADFLDLQNDFSEDDSPFSMTLAAPETVADAFMRKGVGDDTPVVFYSRRSMSWSTRFWWMLRWLSFDNAAILDGGFDKWSAEGRPISTEASDYPEGQLTIDLRPELFVGKDAVLDAIDDPETCTISALGRDIHAGESLRYGRPGRIAGSVNVPQVELVDPETFAFKPPEEIAAQFEAVGALKAKRQLIYCGGAIFATLDAFWLHQLGQENVAVYENSMSEWGPDESLPMETG